MITTLSEQIIQLIAALNILSTALAASVPIADPLPQRKDFYSTQGEIRVMISDLARYHRVSGLLALELAFIESRFDPDADNPHSTAQGLYQFLNGTWNTHCSGDRDHPYDNANCALWMIAHPEESEGGLKHWLADENTKRKLKQAGLI